MISRKALFRLLLASGFVVAFLLLSLFLFSLIPPSVLQKFGVEVHVVQESGRPFSLDEVRVLPDTAWVSPQGRHRLDYGHSDNSVWVRFKAPQDLRAQAFVVYLDDTLLHHVELFVPTGRGSYRSERWGVLYPRGERARPFSAPVFEINPEVDAADQDFFLRIKSPTPFAVDPLVVPLSDWHFAKRPDEILKIFVLGSILMASILALTSAAVRRDKEHFLLGAYCLFSFLMFFTLSGLFHYTAVADFSSLGVRLPYLFGGPMMILFLLLCRNALNLKFRKTPILFSIFVVLLVGILLTILQSLVRVNAFTEVMSNLLGGLASFFGLFAGLVLIGRRRHASFFVASQSVFVLGSIGFLMALQGFLPLSVVTKNLFGIGSALSVCILSFRLKDELFRLNGVLLARSRALENEVVARKRLQAELEDRTVEVAQVSYLASLGELSAGISHEIRNPLATIALNSQLVSSMLNQDAAFPPALRERCLISLRAMSKNVERIKRILDALKQLSWTSRGHEKADVSLREMIEAVATLAGERLRSLNVELRLEIPPGPHIVRGSDTALSQIVINLVNNACDAVSSLEERWIEVKLESTPLEVKVSVTDSGNGIPDELADKVMRPFFTTKTPGNGTGLGLSLSRRFAEANGGTLTLLRSSPKTCFVLSLPKQPRGSQSADHAG